MSPSTILTVNEAKIIYAIIKKIYDGFGYFRYLTFFFLNISTLWKYILKNCRLRFVFPNSLELYISGLRATKILLRSMLCFVFFFYFLCNRFVLVSEPIINLAFYKYNAITRIDSGSNFIKFYAYYFGSYDTLRNDFDQKNHVALHTKINLKDF